jgi:hypothetical protein
MKNVMKITCEIKKGESMPAYSHTLKERVVVDIVSNVMRDLLGSITNSDLLGLKR